MSNPYYSASGNPATGSEGLSALIRAEYLNISAGFDLLPVFSGNGSKAVVVNPGGTALMVTTGTFALAGNFSTTGAFDTVLAQGASVTLTLPVVSGTLATLAGTETFSNKTLVAPALGTPVSGVATNLTGTAAGLTAGNATNAVNATNATNATTATNQSGGTVAATTLSASSTVSGAGFTARFSAPGPIGDVTPSTAAFTTLSASSTVSGAGITARFSTPGPIGDSSPSTAAFTTLAASSTVSGNGFTARFSTPGPIGDSSPSTGAFTTLAASSTVSGAGFTARFATPGPIGSTSASTGAFTTISASSQITSTVSTGTAPLVIASTTNVANLNASSLSGATFAAPGTIGGGTPAAGTFTALTSTTGLTVSSGGASITGIIGTSTFFSTNADPAGNAVTGLAIASGTLSAYSGSAGGTLRVANAAGGTGPLLEFFNGIGGNVGSISTNGATTAFNTTSDERLKIAKGLISFGSAADIIDEITALWFVWKSNPDADSEPGFFAQQVHRICPWMVTPGSGAPGAKDFVPWKIDASKLLPFVIAYIQGLDKRIARLERGA